jgi:ribosomal protein S18 acetylase RimI-like enzyme
LRPSHEIATADMALAQRLEQSVSLGPAPWAETVNSGPFRAYFARHTRYPELNYAMPVASLGSAAELGVSLRELRGLFAERGCRLRLEFVGELWPELAAALDGAGLTLEGDEPLMACAPDGFQPITAPGVSIRPLAADPSDADLAAFLTIRDSEWGPGGPPPSAEAVAQLRAMIGGGAGTFALATLDGEPAGTGRCQSSDGELGEITAIVTRPALRRRGVAATVTTFLVREHFAAGGALAWLSAANPAAQSVYTRLGFRAIGSLLNYEEA